MILVVGDVLLDRDYFGVVERLAPDAPVPVLSKVKNHQRLGGAGLAARQIRDLGHEVVLVAPIADDVAGSKVRALARGAGVELLALPTRDATRIKERYGTDEQLLLRMDLGQERCAPTSLAVGVADVFARAEGILVSDYGGGLTSEPMIRSLIAESARRVPVVWDPHPRGAVPVPELALITPNRAEARAQQDLESRAHELAGVWRSPVVITAGALGAVACLHGGYSRWYPTEPVTGDVCGAGDAFAAAAICSLVTGAHTDAAIEAAVVHASAWVAGEKPQDREIVVATGGCFDLLHVGHIATLNTAAALGDRLIVLLNSDKSVRELKGEGRPANNQDDRAEILRALSMVDDVIIFDELTPERALSSLQPDIWVKGGDYAEIDLPEIKVMDQWGGSVVFAPYIDGYSTSELLTKINE